MKPAAHLYSVSPAEGPDEVLVSFGGSGPQLLFLCTFGCILLMKTRDNKEKLNGILQ